MGICSSRSPVIERFERQDVELSIGEIRTALFACQLCQLAYEDSEDSGQIFQASNSYYFDEHKEHFYIYTPCCLSSGCQKHVERG